MRLLVLPVIFKLVLCGKLEEPQLEGREATGEFIQQFLSSVGSKLGNLIGFSYIERKNIPEKIYKRTQANVTVKLPTCSINSGICTSEGQPLPIVRFHKQPWMALT